jgi:hypothetical protein
VLPSLSIFFFKLQSGNLIFLLLLLLFNNKLTTISNYIKMLSTQTHLSRPHVRLDKPQPRYSSKFIQSVHLNDMQKWCI